MDTVRVRDIVIGEGIPKICVPVFERTKEEIRREAEHIAEIKPDIVEFRADRFEHHSDPARLADVLAALREAIGDIPLLFTLRTAGEGGEADIDGGAYVDIIIKACGTGLIDIVDVETFGGSETGPVIEAAHSAGVKVIASHHDFEKTPGKDDILASLSDMQDTGADIVKIAVMPNSLKDVSTLIAAAEEMTDGLAKCPVVAISMGELGTVSRIAGEAYGSAMTFGSASKQSAPGQIGAEELRESLRDFHEELAAEMPGDRKE